MTNNFENNIDINSVVMFPSVHGSVNVVMYNINNTELRNFLSLFDVWGSKGNVKKSIYNSIDKEIWFEMSREFYEIIDTYPMRLAFSRLNVSLVCEG